MNDVEHRKEVFAWYGAASYFAQCVEVELTNLLVVSMRHAVPIITNEIAAGLEAYLSEKTMGALIQILKQNLPLNEESSTRLDAALSKRNYLMHSFFFVHAHSMRTADGREKMLSELRVLAREFEEVDTLLTCCTRLFLKMMGVSEEQVQAALRDAETDGGQSHSAF